MPDPRIKKKKKPVKPKAVHFGSDSDADESSDEDRVLPVTRETDKSCTKENASREAALVPDEVKQQPHEDLQANNSSSTGGTLSSIVNMQMSSSLLAGPPLPYVGLYGGIL